MKPKVFREPLWPILMPVCLLLMGGSSVFIWGAVLMVEGVCRELQNPGSSEVVEWIIAAVIFVAFAIFIFMCGNNHYFYDIAFGRLCVYEDKVALRRFLRKSRTMKIEDCKYVGVDDYSLLNKALPICRGDEISYVYLSEQPYPKKYRGKISMLKNKKGFIKFHYSDELAEALFEVLPDEKTYLLKCFYNQMKLNDRLTKAKKRKTKKKKK